jgi:two-component system response regulator YesN
MYKVVVVDDEQWVVESLKTSIPWEEAGFEVVATASDGEQALSEIERYKPDVVFTDIRMPIMSGLDLIRQARRRGISSEFVIVSGYAEFAYAQKALRYGITDYCLKPLEINEVVEVLRRVSERLAARDQKQADTIVLAENYEQSTLQAVLSTHGVAPGAATYRLLISSTRNGMDSVYERAILSTRLGPRKHLWVLTDAAYEELKLSATVSDLKPIGVSRAVTTEGELRIPLGEADVAATASFMGMDGGLVEHPDSIDPAPLQETLGEIERAISSGSDSAVSSAFGTLASAINTYRYPASYATYIHNTVVYFLSKSESSSLEPIVDMEEIIALHGDIAELLRYLEECALSAGPVVRASPVHGQADEVISYVDDHYLLPISLVSLAERFGLSRSALSRLFKAKTGKTLGTYIVQGRISYARDLLESSDLPIGDVAEESGFESYFYFARVFKREVGMTATEYRAARRSS